MRCWYLTSFIVLAACGHQSPPPILAAAPPSRSASPLRSAVSPVTAPRPPWVARKVVANGSETMPRTLVAAPGEGWSQIALRAGVPAGALMAANGLAPTALLKAGQSVRVPAGRVHVVAFGETGIAIARAYGATWAHVVGMNRLDPPYRLEIGDRLLLPSKRQVAAMSIEERARAFRIDIDDLITGSEPAVDGVMTTAPRAARTRPRPVRGPAPAVATATANKGANASAAMPAANASAAMPAASRPLPALPAGSPSFAWPLSGRILSGFGPKPGGRYNDGVNLKASAGTPVRAAADGVVAYAGDAVTGFGNLILIKHADGWVTAYGHNEALLVVRGARVSKGDIIARSGATGSVDEPQLHFEMRRGRAAVDPVKLLPARE